MENLSRADPLENFKSPPRKTLNENLNNSSYEPVSFSPTANLKLLTRVATDLVRTTNRTIEENAEQRSGDKEDKCTYDCIKTIHNYSITSRKEKSLRLMCDRFISFYPLNITPGEYVTFSLFDIAKRLDTEKRRVYDIINVLEGLQMTVRIAKNKYIWYGVQNLHMTLSHLKGLAEKVGLSQRYFLITQEEEGLVDSRHSQILKQICDLKTATIRSNQDVAIKKEPCECVPRSESCDACIVRHDVERDDDISVSDCTVGGRYKYILAKTPQQDVGNENEETVTVNNGTKVSSSVLQRDSVDARSLGILSQKFMMLMLAIGKENIVNVELSSKLLLDGWLDGQLFGITSDNVTYKMIPEGMLKSKVRRLYDIANVLSAFNLIRKVDREAYQVKKPSYKYSGPDIEAFPSEECVITSALVSKHSLLGDKFFLQRNSTYLQYKPAEDQPWIVVPRHENTQSEEQERFTKNEVAKAFGKRKFKSLLHKHLTSSQDTTSEGASTLCRTKSEEFPPSAGAKRGLNSIFNVAEIELKRLKKGEKLVEAKTDEVKKRLFTRFKSEPCIMPSAEKEMNLRRKEYQLESAVPSRTQNTLSSRQGNSIPAPLANIENLMKNNHFKKPAVLTFEGLHRLINSVPGISPLEVDVKQSGHTHGDDTGSKSISNVATTSRNSSSSDTTEPNSALKSHAVQNPNLTVSGNLKTVEKPVYVKLANSKSYVNVQGLPAVNKKTAKAQVIRIVKLVPFTGMPRNTD